MVLRLVHRRLLCPKGIGNRFNSSVVVLGDDAAYTKLKDSPGKKIFYFTASWCPPCKRIGPIFELLSNETPDVAFVKVDVDQLSDSAAGAGIQSVPTFQFRNGKKKVFEFSGADEKMLKTHIQQLLQSSE